MKLSNHDAALIRDLKNQPLALILVYIAAGVAGLALSIFIDFNLYLKLLTVFLCGFIIGISAEKLVSQKIRKIALNLMEIREQ
ncbi:hypothetical protein [Microcoleus sp. FACHB-68]|uniref:hypothetical protein n=1 Tax=Microcoleus sp. FACHB-68 TaxID=2692826 RepID=UPI0016860E89|nr:hypothetical protein [Microcoleus sp. FACHB-68]MBD1939336.1 hypothetical protein [Microcoleus sp. FACHB-68]